MFSELFKHVYCFGVIVNVVTRVIHGDRVALAIGDAAKAAFSKCALEVPCDFNRNSRTNR